MTKRFQARARVGCIALLLSIGACAAPQSFLTQTETLTLTRWRDAVGPAVSVAAPSSAQPSNRLTIISWNTALGAGDICRIVNDVRRRNGADAPIVLLLQEVYRGGPEVPGPAIRSVAFASMIRGVRADGGRDEIEQVAAQLGMQAYYAPSMRNGAPVLSDEDRGNAILTNLRMSDVSAHELPFERQRRVAVTATVHGTRGNGEPWKVRVASVHLDNMVGARRLWIAGAEYGRVRQTRGLLQSLDTNGPIIVGGDFNTWFGFADAAYREAHRAFPQTHTTDRRATFAGLLRLDHLFYRLPEGWDLEFRRADDRFGSDHYPLIATVRLD